MTTAQKNSPAHEAGQSSETKRILPLTLKAFNAIHFQLLKLPADLLAQNLGLAAALASLVVWRLS